MRGLIVSETHYAQIVEWCVSKYPAEACGLLAGTSDWRVSCVYPVENAEVESPSTRYFMDPSGQIRAVRDAEQKGLEVIGAFHSHTHSEARPSATDIELAMYPEWVWVIVSLRSFSNPVVRAFTIGNSSATEVEILVRK